MARTATLTVLRNRVIQRADLGTVSASGTRFTTDELNSYIQESATELYDLVLSRWPDYKLSTQAISTVAGTATVSLPSTFYRARGVDIVASGRTIPLQLLQFEDRASYGSRGVPAYYAVWSASVYLFPTPDAVYTGTLYYIPVMAEITDGAPFDGINGWEEYVVDDVAAKCRRKDDLDEGAFQAAKAIARRRVIDCLTARDGGPLRTARTRNPRAIGRL